MEMEREEKYITLKEAVDEYPFSRTTLYQFHRQGKLHFFTIPGKRHTYLLRSELDELRKPQPKK